MKIQKTKSSEVFDLYAQKMYKQAYGREIVDVIKALYNSGLPLEEISKRLDNPSYTLETIKEILGLVPPKTKPMLPLNSPNPKDVLPDSGDLAKTEILPNPTKNPLDSGDVTSPTLAPHRLDLGARQFPPGMSSTTIEGISNLLDIGKQQFISCRSSITAASEILKKTDASHDEIANALTKITADEEALKATIRGNVEITNTIKREGSDVLRKELALYEETHVRAFRYKEQLQAKLGQVTNPISTVPKTSVPTPPPSSVTPPVIPPLNTIDDVTEATSKILAEQGIKTTAKESELLAESLSEAEKSGTLSVISAELKAIGDETNSAIASSAAQSASRASQSAVSQLAATNPSAARVANQSIAEAVATGERRAASAINAPVGKNVTPDAQDLRKRKQVLNEGKLKLEEKKLVQNKELDEAKLDLDEKKFIQNKNFEERKYRNERLKDLLFSGVPKAVGGVAGAASGLGGVLFSVVAAGLVAYGAWYLLSGSDEESKQHIDSTDLSLRALLEQLNALQFTPGSDGEARTNELSGLIAQSVADLKALTPDLTPEQFTEIYGRLDILKQKLSLYFQDMELIEQDLIQDENNLQLWNTIKHESLPALVNELNSFQEYLFKKMKEAEQKKDEKDGRSVTGPGTPGIPGSTDPAESDLAPMIIPVYGQEIDISKASPGFRSAAPRIIAKVLDTPEGKAFVDPSNQWGGWLGRTNDPKSDYLRALKYLYLNRVFDRGDLRKFIRDNMAKAGRKRLSGWKNSVKYYRNNKEKYANDAFFTQKFIKPANSISSSVSFLEDNPSMIKNADQFSKGYYQDAIKNLDDQYAKSYYSSLKGMYDQKPKKTKADYGKLYEVHAETGADLIVESHPKSINVADAIGNGGLVENGLEQQRRIVEVALSVPSGNFRARYAWVIENLVKLADEADLNGMTDASDLIDLTLKKLASI